MAVRKNGIELKYLTDINHDFKYELKNNTQPIFKLNNWNDEYRSHEGLFKNMLDIINIIHENNCAIWFNAHGDLCYRLSIDGDIIISSWKKIGFVFHNLFGLDIEVKRYDYSEERKYTEVTPQNKSKLKYTIYIDNLTIMSPFVKTNSKSFFIPTIYATSSNDFLAL